MTNALQEPCWSFLFDICSLNSTEYCKAKAILNYSGKVNTWVHAKILKCGVFTPKTHQMIFIQTVLVKCKNTTIASYFRFVF